MSGIRFSSLYALRTILAGVLHVLLELDRLQLEAASPVGERALIVFHPVDVAQGMIPFFGDLVVGGDEFLGDSPPGSPSRRSSARFWRAAASRWIARFP